MAIKEIKNNLAIYTITSIEGKTRASFIPERGGICSSIIMPYQNTERELLFLHDYFWENQIEHLPGAWPFLFPICARIERMGQAGNYLYDGKVYHMSIHGFAWQLPWKILDQTSSNQLTLELTSTPETLAQYPFKFKVQLTYTVTENKLTCHQNYSNLDSKPMPYYAGFHPYFLTPNTNQGKEKVLLNFNPIRALQYNDRLTDIVGTKQPHKLPCSIADPLINEQLAEVQNGNIFHLQYPDGFNLYMHLSGKQNPNLFKYAQIYTITEKPFICVEPWMAFPNALNTISGVQWLEPNTTTEGDLELYQ